MKDQNLNTQVRKVNRPHVAYLYFSSSNAINVLNQSRQFELCLEKHWVTQDGFFRIVTTLFGVTVVDCWVAYRWHLHHNHRHKNISLIDYVNMATYDLIHNPYSKSTPDPTPPMPIMPISPPPALSSPPNIITLQQPSSIDSKASPISNITCDPFFANPNPSNGQPNEHTLKRASEQVVNVIKKDRVTTQSTRTVRNRCKVCGRKTSWFCVICSGEQNKKVWICHKGTTMRGCVDRHCEV